MAVLTWEGVLFRGQDDLITLLALLILEKQKGAKRTRSASRMRSRNCSLGHFIDSEHKKRPGKQHSGTSHRGTFHIHLYGGSTCPIGNLLATHGLGESSPDITVSRVLIRDEDVRPLSLTHNHHRPLCTPPCWARHPPNKFIYTLHVFLWPPGLASGCHVQAPCAWHAVKLRHHRSVSPRGRVCLGSRPLLPWAVAFGLPPFGSEGTRAGRTPQEVPVGHV